jgi:NTP pyrophosphatase (non-canonical NTP hydrolase)
MELKQLENFQKEFDARHEWDFSNPNNNEEWLKHLQYSTIGMTGEFGEFANVVKKILREFRKNKTIDDENKEKLKEELVDVFIYLIKLSGQVLKMDLEKEYFEKMKVNEEKFKKFLR